MYIDTSHITRGGKTYTRHLLRESYRAHGKVLHRTIANVSQCSAAEIEALRLALRHKEDLVRGEAYSGNAQQSRKELLGRDRAAPTARRLIRQAGDPSTNPSEARRTRGNLPALRSGTRPLAWG